LIKHIEEYNSKALINSEMYRQYVENFESEIIRGISKLITLHAIKQEGEEGVYGYKLARNLKEDTGDAMIIGEGTLYPLLRKLKSDELLRIDKKEYNGRLRTYYIITPAGEHIYNHLMGFLTNLFDKLSHIIDIKVELNKDKYIICPNCSNRIELEDTTHDYCEACGLSLKSLIKNIVDKKSEKG